MSFSADCNLIHPGDCVKIQWHEEGIDSVFYQNQATVGPSSLKEYPTSDTVYALRVKLRTQAPVLRNVAIYVGNFEP